MMKYCVMGSDFRMELERIGRQGKMKECVSSLSSLANEKFQADGVSDNDILGKSPGIKIYSCILN